MQGGTSVHPELLNEKRVEYHAFISYGPLTKRHNNRYAPACNGEERVVMEALVSHSPLTERLRYASACNGEERVVKVMEALVSRTRISATPTNSHDCEDYSAPPSCIQTAH